MSQLPLSGRRVLDLSRVLAGPFATQQLGDLGAEIIKVESVHGGDLTRAWGPPFAPDGRSAYFLSINRGKRSLAVDLEHPDGQAIVRDLARTSDVVIENFRSHSLERWGLALADLRAADPRLVTCRITGFGDVGPRGGEGGFDALIQAMSGFMAITGPAEGPPSKLGVAVVDVLTGLYAATAIASALFSREASGEGGHIEVALFDAALSSLVNVAGNVLLTGEDARRFGNAHPSIVPYEVFRAADGELLLAVGNDRQWRALARVLDRPEWLERRDWATNADRVRNREEVIRTLSAEFARHPRAQLLDRLRRGRVPVGPVATVAEALSDPAARAGVVTHDDGTRSVASPIRWGGRVLPTASPPPALGEHSREILQGLGRSDREIEAWIRAGVVMASGSGYAPPD